MSRPHVTVAIPTLGRSPRLAEIVSSVAAADGTDEILLVRNGPGSRDAVSPSFPGGVRVLDLERPSLQAARNLAVAEASHGVVAFLDDDAVPEPGWLPALVDFVTRHPDFGAVGGPALLPGEYRVPAWMTPAALGYLGIVEYEPREIRCPPWRYPYGCNFAVRRDAVPAVGGFDMRIGYRGRSLIANGETELFRRLQKAGLEVWYTPRMAVRHHVDPRRLRLAYLLRRAHAQGRADARTARIHPDLPVERGPLAVMRAFRWTAAAGYRLLAGQRRAACDHVLRAARRLGAVRG